jgi:hypothetical protein
MEEREQLSNKEQTIPAAQAAALTYIGKLP